MSYLGIPPFGRTSRTVTEVAATSGQTTFYPTGGYTVGYIDVVLNGIQLNTTDFTATDGLAVVLLSPAAVNDELHFTSYTVNFVEVDPSGLAVVALSGTFADLTAKPTTISGYGITDAQPLDADLTAIAAISGTTGLLKKTAANIWTLDTSAYLTAINSGQVTGALGFTPYNSSNPSGYISGNQTITFTGDASGSGTTSVALTLANSGVTAGTYGSTTNIPQIAVDAKGRITSVTNVAVSIPSGSITFTGDVTGTGTTGSSTALTLANSGVVAGTYTKTTVDAKGRVTSGTTLSASDIPSLDASKITGGTIDAARLPSYVDDVLEYANLASFPASGETGKIYVALDTNKTYRWSGSAYVYITSGAVDSVAGRTGVVSLVSSDVGLGSVENKSSATILSEISSANVTTALGFTPYNSTNPSGYISGITSGQVTTALGFTPYNATNPSGYITTSALSGYLTSATAASTYQPIGSYLTGITSSQVTTALGFTPYNSSNPNGYITGITSANVTTALGFTPYNSSNPSGYITSSALSGYLTSSTASSTYLPLTGGSVSGPITINGRTVYTTAAIYDNAASGNNIGILFGSDGILPANGAGAATDNSKGLGNTNYRFSTLWLGTEARAPIFYDSNDTSYYVDPASTSSQKTVLIGYSALSPYVYNVASTGYITFGTTSDPANYSILTEMENYNSNHSKLRFKWYTGIQHYASNYYGGHRFYDITGTEYFGIAVGNGANHSYSNYSHRAPIFYDLDNTGYYIDPASTSNLSTTYINTHLYTSYSANNPIIRVSGASSAGLLLQDNSSAYMLQLYGYGGQYGFLASSWGAWDLRKVNGGSLYLSNESTYYYGSTEAYLNRVYGMADIRSPIYYDVNDTSYYVDPHSNSRLSYLGVGNVTPDLPLSVNGSAQISSNLYMGGTAGSAGSWSGRMYSSSGATYINTSTFRVDRTGYGGDSYYFYMDTAGNSYASASFRAPIFYDNDNTNYYLNAAGTSNLDRIAVVRSGQNVYTDADYGYGLVGAYSATRYQGVFAMGDSYKLPASGADTGNLYGLAWSHPNAGGIAGNLADHGLLLLQNGAFKGAWGGGSFRTPGDVRGTIFYDYSDTGYYLDPTSATSIRTVGSWRSDSSTWDGEFSGKIQYHSNHWYIQAADLFIYRNASGSNVFTINQSGTAWASADMRSPIFYDNNDTSYYVDPRSGSRMSGLRLDGVDNQASGEDAILWINKTTNADWAAIVTGALEYGISLRMAASHTYALQATANGSEYSRLGTDLLYHNSNIRTPIFYDYNDTAYYMDPNTTGTSINVAGAIVAGGNITAFSDERLKTNWQTPVTDFVEKLAGVLSGTFTRTDTGQRQAGVGAQSLQPLLPEAVIGTSNLSVAYGNAAMVSAVELAKRVVKQDQKIAELTALVQKLLYKE